MIASYNGKILRWTDGRVAEYAIAPDLDVSILAFYPLDNSLNERNGRTGALILPAPYTETYYDGKVNKAFSVPEVGGDAEDFYGWQRVGLPLWYEIYSHPISKSSINLWVYIDNSQEYTTIIKYVDYYAIPVNKREYSVRYVNNVGIQTTIYAPDICTNEYALSISDGWHNFSWNSRNTFQYDCYIDASLAFTTNTTLSPWDNCISADRLFFGDGSLGDVTHLVDQIRIYSKTLTEQEVANLWNNGNGI